ncbi:MAG: DnaJ domain-containing protein [bacterium]
MLSKRDFYKVLGVAPTATQDEIRKAYRMLSKKYHPDLNPDLKLYSDEKMKELVEAYNVLNDPDSRKEYDKQPQFQVRKSRSGKNLSSHMGGSYTRKPKVENVSFLEKLIAPFFTKKKSLPGEESSQKEDPKQADVHFTLGTTMTENESFYSQAHGEFKLATKFNPNHTEAFYNMGLMCYKMGQFEEAIVNFQKVLVLHQEDQMARKMISLLREDF